MITSELYVASRSRYTSGSGLVFTVAGPEIRWDFVVNGVDGSY